MLSVVFAILFPLLITRLPALTQVSNDQASLEELIRIIPAELLGERATLSPEQLPIVLILGYLIAPLFLVLPLLLSCIIAARRLSGKRNANP
jgi:hypothetical protein